MTDERSTDAPDGVAVREAVPSELAAVLNVLDGAALETDGEMVRERIDRGDVLVAVSDPDDGSDADGGVDTESTTDTVPGADGDSATATVLGAVVLVDDEIEAVAVRRRRRGQHIGTALVEAAAARRERLVAEFDSGVRPFYEALGFDIEPADESERYRGLIRRVD